MESGKVVKFLVIIFAVLTLIFSLLYFREEKQSSVLDEAFVSEAVANIRLRGIEIDDAVIMRKNPDRNIYVFECRDHQEYAERIAAAFAKGFEKDMFTAKLSTPTGFSLALYDNTDKENEVGKFHFSQSDFGFVYSAVGNSISTNARVIYGDEKKINTYKRSFIDRIISQLNNANDVSYKITGCVFEDDYCIVSVLQNFKNIDVNDCYINFVFENDSLVHAVGSWVAYKPESAYHEKLMDGINVLYKLELDSIKRIVGERIVFSLKKGNDNKYFIIPCWEITAENKDGVTLNEYFDAF